MISAILMFIAKWFWLVGILIVLIVGYIYWLIYTIEDFRTTFRIFSHPIEHLEIESKIFIALNILAPIIASFVYCFHDKF